MNPVQSLGAVIDGVPEDLNRGIEVRAKKRAPGQMLGTTSRKEDDEPEIISGVFEGKTLELLFV